MNIVGGATLERPSVKIRSRNLLRWAFCKIESLKNLWPYGSTFTWLNDISDMVHKNTAIHVA